MRGYVILMIEHAQMIWYFTCSFSSVRSKTRRVSVSSAALPATSLSAGQMDLTIMSNMITTCGSTSTYLYIWIKLISVITMLFRSLFMIW